MCQKKSRRQDLWSCCRTRFNVGGVRSRHGGQPILVPLVRVLRIRREDPGGGKLTAAAHWREPAPVAPWRTLFGRPGKRSKGRRGKEHRHILAREGRGELPCRG